MLLPILIVAGVVAQAMAHKYTEYTYIPGFFVQDDLNANATEIGALPARFGLADDKPSHWPRFKERIEKLNRKAHHGESVKVFFLGRHGQGYHNVAETKYGATAWDDYWSKLDGDGDIVWGPDALLTDLGIEQAQDAHNAWVKEIPTGIPVPSVFYTSPMSRAAKTCEITWTGIIIPGSQSSDNAAEGKLHNWWGYPKVVVSENCREVYGEHTCDQRHNRTYIKENFPEFVIEKGFTEQDELWTPERETDAHAEVRAKAVLDQVWEKNSEDTYISITAHSGLIDALLRVVGRGSYSLTTGGVIPIVVKAVKA